MKELVPVLFDAAAIVLLGIAALCLLFGQWRAMRAGIAVAGAIAPALIAKGDRLELVKFSVLKRRYTNWMLA